LYDICIPRLWFWVIIAYYYEDVKEVWAYYFTEPSVRMLRVVCLQKYNVRFSCNLHM